MSLRLTFAGTVLDFEQKRSQVLSELEAALTGEHGPPPTELRVESVMAGSVLVTVSALVDSMATAGSAGEALVGKTLGGLYVEGVVSGSDVTSVEEKSRMQDEMEELKSRNKR